MNSFDISINEIERTSTHGLDYSHLIIEFSGKDVTPILANTIRRILMNNIPTYAFPVECMIVNENTSVFNNDQLRMRLSCLPILNVSTELAYLPEEYWSNVNYADKDRPRHPMEQQIDIYVSANNLTENVINVTTNDIKYFIDGSQVQSPYNKEYPILIVKLRPRETFVCKLASALGVGERNAIWNAASDVFYTITDKSITMTIESRGQMDEMALLIKVCSNVAEKIATMKHSIKEKYEKEKETNRVILTFDNETYTVFSLIVYYLQQRTDVEIASVGKMNDLVKQVTLDVTYKQTIKNPLEPIYQSIDKVNNVFAFIEALLKKQKPTKKKGN